MNGKNRVKENLDDYVPDPYMMAIFTKKILEYASLGLKDYPWRKNRTVYKTFIAEFFLQRTKADQVAPVFLDFIREFPDETAFLNAKPERLEQYLKRLGLLKRLDYLLKIIALFKSSEFNYHGLEHLDERELLSLPGIGPYTARAILCFGKNQRVAILDANIIRIFKRFFGIPDRNRAPKSDPFYWDLADKLLPEKNYVEYNYALIDLGSELCLPRTPKCKECILSTECIYYAESVKKG